VVLERFLWVEVVRHLADFLLELAVLPILWEVVDFAVLVEQLVVPEMELVLKLDPVDVSA